MTAPAFVRHWNDPRRARADRRAPEQAGRAGRPVPGRAEQAEGARAAPRAAAGVVVRDRMAALADWIRRVGPLGAVWLTGVVAHVALTPHLAVRGAAPDVLLVSVVAVAVGGGSRAGAGYGFAAGLGADLFLTTPLGTAALAFTVVGHVLGRMGRPGLGGSSAAALCRPDSACFACRTVGRHGRLTRAQRRAAARRRAVRRSVLLTFLGVGAGRLGTAAGATALAGVPFPGAPGLFRIAAAAAVSAVLGPLAFALARRGGAHAEGAR